MSKDVDRESIFQLVKQKKWDNLIDIFKNNKSYEAINSDSILGPFIDNYFINELLSDNYRLDLLTNRYILQNFYILQISTKHNFTLSELNFKKLIFKLIASEENLETSQKYASHFPQEQLCLDVINKYNNSLPRVVDHTQKSKIYVTTNRNIANVDASISLFKSNQEYQFYKAVKECYQMYLAFPNVALNAIIDINQIKSNLTKDELKYFWNALIDCVVVDPDNNYRPTQYFELDSDFHDSKEQKNKDSLKDSILAKAGQRLIRIRRLTSSENETDFIKLIREISYD